jgi:hypothetical protein
MPAAVSHAVWWPTPRPGPEDPRLPTHRPAKRRGTREAQRKGRTAMLSPAPSAEDSFQQAQRDQDEAPRPTTTSSSVAGGNERAVCQRRKRCRGRLAQTVRKRAKQPPRPRLLSTFRSYSGWFIVRFTPHPPLARISGPARAAAHPLQLTLDPICARTKSENQGWQGDTAPVQSSAPRGFPLLTRSKRELRRSYVRPTVCTNPGGNDVVYGFSYWYSDGYIYHTSPVGLYPCILGTSQARSLAKTEGWPSKFATEYSKLLVPRIEKKKSVNDQVPCLTKNGCRGRATAHQAPATLASAWLHRGRDQPCSRSRPPGSSPLAEASVQLQRNLAAPGRRKRKIKKTCPAPRAEVR